MCISYIDPVSAPNISATGTAGTSSFNLRTTPPTTSPQCFNEYYLVVRQNGSVAVNATIAKDTLDNRNVDLHNIIDIPIITCMYNYTFELTPVNGKLSSGEQHGDPNLQGTCT